jgi:hypothetical protein
MQLGGLLFLVGYKDEWQTAQGNGYFEEENN